MKQAVVLAVVLLVSLTWVDAVSVNHMRRHAKKAQGAAAAPPSAVVKGDGAGSAGQAAITGQEPQDPDEGKVDPPLLKPSPQAPPPQQAPPQPTPEKPQHSTPSPPATKTVTREVDKLATKSVSVPVPGPTKTVAKPQSVAKPVTPSKPLINCDWDSRYAICKSFLRWWRCGTVTEDEKAVVNNVAKDSDDYPENVVHEPKDFCHQMSDVMPGLKDECDETIEKIKAHFQTLKQERKAMAMAAKRAKRKAGKSIGDNAMPDIPDEVINDGRDEDTNPLELDPAKWPDGFSYQCKYNGTTYATGCPEAVTCYNMIPSVKPRQECFIDIDGPPKYCECTDQSAACDWPEDFDAKAAEKPKPASFLAMLQTQMQLRLEEGQSYADYSHYH
eukprot:GFYU01001278.1.p1 GENE.GFYU01001278.1~~GFYU01001278.1.p1  ORF type:complete len:387 (+),score=104.15 GFYU01001278.1:110-1270(+)